MPSQNQPLLVSTSWLSNHLNAPDIRVLDGTVYLPGDARDASALYAQAHIPGAQFFDIDTLSDEHSPLPHMLPPVEKFISHMRRMGIGDGHRVIVYDQHGLFSAARVWWMFCVFGHKDVAVLDGGLPKWMAEGHLTEDLEPEPRERHFTASRDSSMIRTVSQVAGAIKLGDEQIIDARAPSRFRGEEPEPRPGLRSGHIPGARNVHYRSLLNDDQTMKSPDELRKIFEAAGIDLSKPVTTSCGSGITAAILSLALNQIGHTRNALYDGSWAEWGAYPDLEIETG